MPDSRQDQLRVSAGARRTRGNEISAQGAYGSVTTVVLCLLILGSVDWIAWLALQSAGSSTRAAIVGCLSALALAMVRACTVVIHEFRKEHSSAETSGDASQKENTPMPGGQDDA